MNAQLSYEQLVARNELRANLRTMGLSGWGAILKMDLPNGATVTLDIENEGGWREHGTFTVTEGGTATVHAFTGPEERIEIADAITNAALGL